MDEIRSAANRGEIFSLDTIILEVFEKFCGDIGLRSLSI
jgi:hypothetical protein